MTPLKPKPWRVRVRRTIEDWIDVRANTKEDAEREAATYPNVVSVLSGMTIRGDKPLDGFVHQDTVEDWEDD